MSDRDHEERDERTTIALPEGVLAVRRGPGANCSSIGSVVDLLFGAAVVGGAIWAGILASLRDVAPETASSSKKDEERS
jgi:hypothetical protein